MKKLAVFYITYNHPEVVDDMLNYSIQFYYERGIDLFYFEGSDCEQTAEVINKYRNKGFDNLYYRHIPNTTIEERLAIILDDKEFISQYEYIWPSKDRSCCDGVALDRVLSEIEAKRDVIMLTGIWGKTDYYYEDPTLFYRDWGWLASSLDVLVYKTSTVFAEPRFSDYGYIFGIIPLLFDQLMKHSGSTVKALGENAVLVCSNKVGSTWENDVFKVWKDDWIYANFQLSSEFDLYKKDTIKKATQLPWILGTKVRLYDLHTKGILIEEKLPEIEKDWELVSDIPTAELEEIAKGHYDPYHDLSILTRVDENIELLLKALGMVKSGRINANLLPVDDFVAFVLGYMEDKMQCTDEKKILMYGSIKDIGELMKCYIDDNERFVKLMQLFIVLLLK